MVGSIMVWHLPPSCRAGGFPVHHDPMHGIVANPENREWEPFPLSFFVVCDNPIHGNMVNWDPTISQVIDLLGPFQNCNASITSNLRGRAIQSEYIRKARKADQLRPTQLQ